MLDRVLIAGTHSGCGKTTVTCAVLAALQRRGAAVSAYKCGPDYIDPMFHRSAIGVPAYNLDPFFSTKQQLCAALALNTSGFLVIEGVMGYYDGVNSEGAYSTFDVANQTDTPVILVLDCKGMYASAGAVLHGFRTFRPGNNIRGVIFNNATPMLYEGLQKIALSEGVTPLGYLPRTQSVSVGSRHLGLITAQELSDIQEKLAALADLAEQTLDLDGIVTLGGAASALISADTLPAPVKRVRIAIARDEAFCFLYQENLDMLMRLGCELIYFSPLADAALPSGVSGLVLPGGYPELHLKKLSENRTMRQAVCNAIQGGMPTIAECGGFLYLHDTLDGAPMAGVIHAAAEKTDRLQRFGYVTLTAKRDNLLCKAGERIRSHSFHYYDSTDAGMDFVAEKPLSARRWDCIHATGTLYAGFPHLYFPARPEMAERFVEKAANYAAL